MRGRTISLAAAVIGGGALITSMFFTSAAGASDLQQALHYFGITACSSPSPCTGGNNAGAGAGVSASSAGGVGLLASAKLAPAVQASATKNNGVRGDTHYKSAGQSSGFNGVAGFDDSTDGGNLDNGVYGQSYYGAGVRGVSNNSAGVWGVSSISDGVYGSTTGGINGAGVFGADNSGTALFGVEGYSSSGTGVYGNTLGGTGVMGNSNSANGVFGQSSSSNGVEGSSASGIGVYGTSLSSVAVEGVSFSGNGVQAIQAIGGTSGTGAFTIAAFNSSSAPTFVTDNAGNAYVFGSLYTEGSCSSGCAKTRNGPSGEVQRSIPQEAEPTMEDVGEAQLTNGQSFVHLDPAFANVIDTHASYIVFVTPEGPTRGLYVTNKTATGFEVMENPGGHSTVAFGYRIVAKPYGVQSQRLPYMSASQMPRPARSVVTLRKQHVH
jgi:hypothetical protein